MELPTNAQDWRASSVKRAQAAAIAAIGAPLIWLLGRTLRWRVDGLSHLDEVEHLGRRPILALWHARILHTIYFFRGQGIVGMASRNFDGEWISRIIQRFGLETARGSSSRGSGEALRQLTRDMARGRAVAFTVDGPRGPARRVQRGVVWLAKVTGNPVVPFHLDAARYWTIKSWDRTQIPKPFSTVALAVGKPIDVTPGATDEMLEVKRQEVEQALYGLEARTRALLEG